MLLSLYPIYAARTIRGMWKYTDRAHLGRAIIEPTFSPNSVTCRPSTLRNDKNASNRPIIKTAQNANPTVNEDISIHPYRISTNTTRLLSCSAESKNPIIKMGMMVCAYPDDPCLRCIRRLWGYHPSLHQCPKCSIFPGASIPIIKKLLKTYRTAKPTVDRPAMRNERK